MGGGGTTENLWLTRYFYSIKCFAFSTFKILPCWNYSEEWDRHALDHFPDNPGSNLLRGRVKW